MRGHDMLHLYHGGIIQTEGSALSGELVRPVICLETQQELYVCSCSRRHEWLSDG